MLCEIFFGLKFGHWHPKIYLCSGESDRHSVMLTAKSRRYTEIKDMRQDDALEMFDNNMNIILDQLSNPGGDIND